MSISTELTTLSTNITNAYNAIQTKGGTIPTNKNTENLETAINSIISYENSLRNMFINKVLKDPNLDDDTKEKVIFYGLAKLMKEEE